jgi:nitrogen fixation protein FixH
MKTTRNFWPLGIIAAFVVFFAGITTVVVIAVTHRDSLVSANYYEQELKFQDQIDNSDRAKNSGARLMFDAAAGHLAVSLPVAQLARDFSGTISLYRPSEPNLDREFQLEPRADGTQLLDISRLAAGNWSVRLAWRTGGENYFLAEKIVVAGK